MDTSSETEAPVENLKFVVTTLAKYNSQKSENEKLITKLEAITQQLKTLYNIDFDTDFSTGNVSIDLQQKNNEYEDAAQKVISLSNENYKILNNLQYQLRVQNKLIKFVSEYTKLIDLIEDYLLTNDFEIYKSSAGNQKLVQILQDDLQFLEQKNKVINNTEYKNMYRSLSIKLRDVLTSLEKIEKS